MTPEVEREILKAFTAIHSLNVVHGDIRTDNILIADGGTAAFVIDFEYAEIIDEWSDAKNLKISQETQFIKELLDGLKRSSGGRQDVTDMSVFSVST